MKYIPATAEYGLVIRKKSLAERNITSDDLSEIMTDIDVMGDSDDLISFGPMFGEEALEEIKARLSASGLEYVDDYVDLSFLLPHWVKLGVSLA